MNKECNRCHVIKLPTEFFTCKTGKGGKRPECKVCSQIQKRKSYNKSEKSKYNKDYRSLHQNELIEYNRKYYKENLTKNGNNPEAYKRFRELANKKQCERIAKDKSFAMKRNISRLMLKFFKKGMHTFDVVGCSSNEFSKWIDYQLLYVPNLTMDNYGSKWHLDHVKACTTFDLSNKDEQLKCYHWSNISPLERSENIRKTNTTDLKYLQSQLDKYIFYIQLNNIDNSRFDICTTYTDGALTTTTSQKCKDGIQGNDLVQRKNVKDWVIRSQASDLVFLSELKKILQSLKEFISKLQCSLNILIKILEDEGPTTKQ